MRSRIFRRRAEFRKNSRHASPMRTVNALPGVAAAPYPTCCPLVCRLITYWPARSIFISGAGNFEEIRDAHRPSTARSLLSPKGASKMLRATGHARMVNPPAILNRFASNGGSDIAWVPQALLLRFVASIGGKRKEEPRSPASLTTSDKATTLTGDARPRFSEERGRRA